MNEYELEQAQIELETIKENLEIFLIQSYKDGKAENPKESARSALKYLESILEKIIKKQAVDIEFSNGAAPGWYVDIFKYFSLWLEQEIKICELMSQLANET